MARRCRQGIASRSLEDRQAVAAELRRACLHNGFFYVRNHGIPYAFVDAMFAQRSSMPRSPPPIDR